MRRIALVLGLVALAVTALLIGPAGQTALPLPRLAVIIVVDQMRADYVDRFKTDWTSGLKRLTTEGAWFTRAAYPYLTTVTCAGHATIATGAFPSTHGVFQNVWFDRGRNALVTCTEDASVKPIGYGKAVSGGESAANLRIPTFADEMRRQRGARVVSLALKARSAIMLAGHGGDAVTWLSDSLDGWETSSAFGPSTVPQVSTFVSANAIEGDYGKTWEHLLRESAYRESDVGLGETPPGSWTASFPHPLNGNGSGHPDPAFYAEWEASPFADAYIGRMAAALVESMQLGQHNTTDVLTMSFSSPDLVGHGFGPNSQEVHDQLVHLDRTLGTLLDRLDALVGRNAYVLALSSDHGVTEIPEQLMAEKREGGRLNLQDMTLAIEGAANTALGPGQYVSRINGNDIYFAPGIFEKLSKISGAMPAVMAALAAQPGVERVFRADELPAATTSTDPLLRAAALSYVPNRGGDLIYAPKPGWMTGTLGTTHGSANPDDQRVPILLFGQGIKAGQYAEAATPADIAPTLAAVCGITLPKAQGHVLLAAIKSPSTPRPGLPNPPGAGTRPPQ